MISAAMMCEMTDCVSHGALVLIRMHGPPRALGTGALRKRGLDPKPCFLHLPFQTYNITHLVFYGLLLF